MNITSLPGQKTELSQRLRGIKIIFFDAGGTLLNLDAEHICDHLQKTLDISLDPSWFHGAQYQRTAYASAASENSLNYWRKIAIDLFAPFSL
jgi:hypothetical protein